MRQFEDAVARITLSRLADSIFVVLWYKQQHEYMLFSMYTQFYVFSYYSWYFRYTFRFIVT